MAAMAQAGVIQGNEQGKLNPTGTLNRAEMASFSTAPSPCNPAPKPGPPSGPGFLCKIWDREA